MQLKTDYCCYIRREGDNFVILLIWVDDFVSMATIDKLNDAIERGLNNHFEVKSLGRPNLLLGMKIDQTDHLITLSQTHSFDALLEKFGLENANSVSTIPMDVNIKLDLVAEGQEGVGRLRPIRVAIPSTTRSTLQEQRETRV